ncbi:hypothetical protein SAMD00079811_58120 [Scytonema sp. HK-05]|uniref:hypothetical protein n=1 Tax=Scytonema sp. HK-05 TaxID=1137095 RepID=UPI000AAC66C7|nr:hypothetical protein [Scytonema sp. HK-05]BAY48191.1 hypothetical protein SAMD00079811_58120 [Scytonema sp. HK-05]
MKISNTETLFFTPAQPNLLSEKTLTQNSRKAQPKLSMIWVKEFDGERERLVARWVTQD